MALTASGQFFGTMGGGAGEKDCLRVAERVLETDQGDSLTVDLRGDPDQLRHGVCGGTMEIIVTPHAGEADLRVVSDITSELRAGKSVQLQTRIDTRPFLQLLPSDEETLEAENAWVDRVQPDPLLAIFGAGHIGREVARWAAQLDFQVLVHDDRREWLDPDAFPHEPVLYSRISEVTDLVQQWTGEAYLLLVTRGFQTDLDLLEHLEPLLGSWKYLGVLGSKRRIALLRECCQSAGLRSMTHPLTHAPVGLSINAETPAEIAVSILAEVIQIRRK